MADPRFSSSVKKSPLRLFYKIMTILMSVVVLLAIFVYFYLQQPQFAQLPSNVRFPTTIAAEYEQGTFHNQLPTPVMTRLSDKSQASAFIDFLFAKDENSVPTVALPAVKTDLQALDPKENVVVWMGHSSYFIQTNGLRILIDPVFSENASPVPLTNVAFKGSNIYTAKDIPQIDYLLISHDHWDHLDYPTIMSLKDKIGEVITPLGVGTYFRQWGYDPKIIHEADWNTMYEGKNGLQIHTLPARHFSGRLLTRNKTLWGSFALISPAERLYLGGDSGYGPHFKDIGKQFGSFDVAILECGQYNQDWRLIHMTPEETAQAAVDLNAKALMPSHNSKFKLSHHAWNEPLKRVSKASEGKPYRLLTPRIGEKVETDDQTQQFTHWWES